MSRFLNEKDVVELTGISRGRDGKTRYQMQVEALRKMGVPFFVNVRGKPIIPASAIDGKIIQQDEQPTKWVPAALKGQK